MGHPTVHTCFQKGTALREITDDYFWQNERVRLRAIGDDDWERHYLGMFDTNGRRTLDYEVALPASPESQKAMMQSFIDFAPETGRLMFCIETLEGVDVGAINLNGIDEKNGVFGIGIQVYRDYRGKGYATAAMEILLRYAFYERRLNKLNNSVIEGNHASLAMFKKLGAKEEGFRRETVYMNGRYWGETLVGITRADFEAICPAGGPPERE